MLFLTWMVLSVFGFGLLVSSRQAGSGGDGARICRYLSGASVIERVAYGIRPSCPFISSGDMAKPS